MNHINDQTNSITNSAIEQIKNELIDEATKLSSTSSSMVPTYHQLNQPVEYIQPNLLMQQVTYHDLTNAYVLDQPPEQPLYQIPEVIKKRGRGRKTKAGKTLPPLSRSISAPEEDDVVTETIVRGNKRYITVKKTKLLNTISEPSLQQQQNRIAFNKIHHLSNQQQQIAINQEKYNGYNLKNGLNDISDEDTVDNDDSSDENYSDVEKINMRKQKARQTSRRRKRTSSSTSQDIDFSKTLNKRSKINNVDGNSQSTAETYLIDRYKYAVRHIKQGLSVEEACNKYRISKGALLKCLSGGTAPRGKKTRLTENEENSVVEWLISNQNLKYNEAIHLVFQEVSNIFQRANRPNPFSNGRPSMDWWYDFLSRHPQIMASKPEWLKRGKVNDQYILDVQSGKLRCTKFRRALLSAIQYIRSLNDGTNQNTNNSQVVQNQTKNIREDKVKSQKSQKRIPKLKIHEQEESSKSKNNSFIEQDCNQSNNGLLQSMLSPKMYTATITSSSSTDDIYSSDNNFAKTILSSNLIPDQKSINLDNKRLITSLKNVIKPKSNNGHLLLPDDDDDDDIDSIKDSIDPTAFLP